MRGHIRIFRKQIKRAKTNADDNCYVRIIKLSSVFRTVLNRRSLASPPLLVEIQNVLQRREEDAPCVQSCLRIVACTFIHTSEVHGAFYSHGLARNGYVHN